MSLHRHPSRRELDLMLPVGPLFARAEEASSVPRNVLPDGEMSARSAYQIVHDELMLDGNPRLNLATFVTTWMEPEAERLIGESLDRNMVDRDEYPQTAELERRCVSMLSHLWRSTAGESPIGCSTTGSSEAAMLGGLALKWRWRERRRRAGEPADRPNLVMGANVQVCWEKFCRYWDVEPRRLPLEGERLHLGPAEAVALCDEHTIGLVAIMGSTFDGSYEPVSGVAAALDRLHADTGLDVPIHVDAASGGFVAPFLDPEIEWDFRLRRVQSINASGHKYGLVYPGVGWIVWRDVAALPEELVFRVGYLGGDVPTFALNFSRPGGQVIAQYYTFLRLGREGFRRVQQACRDVARHLSDGVSKLGPLDLVTDGSELPVFACAVRDGEGFTAFELSERLRRRGWQVPAYTMPENREDLAVLRIVVRNGFGRDLADLLLADVERDVRELSAPSERSKAPPAGFHH